jgi:hypothetical protein
MKIVLFSLLLSSLLYSQDSSAQIFRLRTTDYGPLVGPAATKWDQALSEVEADINKEFPNAENPKALMTGMANSSVMAGKGIGSDYASRMDVVLIGAGIGVGADLEKDSQTDSDLSGAGVQGGLIIGTNLGWLKKNKILGLYTNRLNVYFNFLKYDLDRDLGKGEKDSLNAKLNSLGFHMSYDLVKGNGSKWLGWGGVKVHTGYERNSTKLTFTSTISEELNEDVGGGATVTGKIEGKPAASISVATQSIPLEVSTNVQLLYVLSLYTGLGVDFNFGSAKGAGALNASESPLRYDPDGTGPTPDQDGPTVQAEADIDGKGSVDSVLTRAFVGAQINLPYMNIFVQADKAFGSELVGATAGVRFVY